MSWFNKKNKQEVAQQQDKLELPQNFAEEVLYLEHQIDQPNLSIQSITQLLELYRKAIEYFSTIQDDKYLIFRSKTQSLLLRKNVSELLNGKKQDVENNNSNYNAEKKKREIQNQLSQQDGIEEVQRFLHNERNNFEKKQTIVVNDLTEQEYRIAQRMLKRVKDPQKLINKSSSMNQLQKLEISKIMDQPQLTTKTIPEMNDEASPNMKIESGILKLIKSQDKDETSANKIDQPEFSPQTSDFQSQYQQKQQTQEQPSLQIKKVTNEFIIAKKEQKIRDMVSKNENLQRQKDQLIKKNTMLPF